MIVSLRILPSGAVDASAQSQYWLYKSCMSADANTITTCAWWLLLCSESWYSLVATGRERLCALTLLASVLCKTLPAQAEMCASPWNRKCIDAQGSMVCVASGGRSKLASWTCKPTVSKSLLPTLL